MTAFPRPTEEPKAPVHNHATRRAVRLEAQKILKWYDKGYNAKAIAHKLGWPNIQNATEYVESVLKFAKKPI